jgi:hypothetical protein
LFVWPLPRIVRDIMNHDLRKRTEDLEQQLLAYASCEPGRLAPKAIDYRAAAATLRELLEATETPTTRIAALGYRDRARGYGT